MFGKSSSRDRIAPGMEFTKTSSWRLVGVVGIRVCKAVVPSEFKLATVQDTEPTKVILLSATAMSVPLEIRLWPLTHRSAESDNKR